MDSSYESVKAGKAQMRPQRRRNERIPLHRHVLVYTDDHPEGLFATTLNWSSEGARIKFSAEIKMPERFFYRRLKNFSIGNAIHCERIWQTGSEVGVAFIKGK